MPVIACPRCQQPLSLDAAVLGQHVQCPACKQVFQTTVAVPAPPVVKKVVATPIAPPPQGVPAAVPAAFDPATAFAGLGQDEPPGSGEKRPGRRPAKKKSLLVPLLLGGAALLLLCCGGGGVGVWYAYQKANPPLAFTPYTTPDGSCSVLMPGTPTDDTQTTPDGTIIVNEFRYWHDKKNMHFELVYRDFSLTDVEQAKAVEQEFADRLGRVGQGPAESKTAVKVGTLFGTDHVYKRNGKTIAAVRELLAKGKQTGRKVLLIAEGDDIPDEDRAKFLNSYKQLKSPK
jgi:hypothetical protein